MKMPSLSNRASHLHHTSSANLPGSIGSGSDARSAVWTRSTTDDVNLSQLHKFWSELSSAERRELLRIDKQTLFEQVRKNLYCSRCHGLLVEGFAQIMNGKNRHASLLAYSNGGHGGSRHTFENGSNGAISVPSDDTRDPFVHSWGGLAATRDNMLTVLDCFLDGTPLEVLQNVFESARTRERERELLYPDACGGGGRGWMSQSIGNFGGNGRGHGMKETCALHTARLSCEALVDFWTALGEETRRSLLRMKEEDFIERLMFRFDSKRFCRDCRRNVLREFKEMKELKRTRKEPRCTRWFCAADTVFRYEVSDSMVHVDWRDCFAGDVGTVYQKFEWGLGTAEGKADILGFEDVGLSETVQIDGLDLSNVSSCHITVKGYKRNGLSTELAAKAHALKGQLCVHRRLIVGDGIVSITKGESIQRFFERAEETEEEEDDDTMDKDGNELDGEGSRPQKHAKSPELARDFLLDAATVIFKEQVEKAFREGTARQNAHSIFVCLALSLLEERVRVACKEITTLEKQNKLLEEEEYEKREEEERRERRKLKEKEKKLRKKEKLKVKERAKAKLKSEVLALVVTSNGHSDNISCATSEEDQDCLLGDQAGRDSRAIDSMSARPSSPDMANARPSGDGSDSDSGSGKSQECSSQPESIAETLSKRDGNGAFIIEQSKSSRRRSQLRKGQGSETSPSSSIRKNLHNVGVRVNGCSPTRDQHTSTLAGRNAAAINGKVENHPPSSGSHSVKRHDSWSNSENVNKHENHQHCACGSPQNGVRVKVHGQRTIGRSGSKDFGSSKSAERDGVSASLLRAGTRNVADVCVGNGGRCAKVELDGLKAKNAIVASAGLEALREQSRREAELADVSMQAHTRTEHGSLPAANGHTEGASSALHHALSNGRPGSGDFVYGHAAAQMAPVTSSPVTGKLVWVSHSMQVPPSSPGSPSMKGLLLSGLGRGASNATVVVKASGTRPSSGRGRRPNGVALVSRAATGPCPGPVVPLSTSSSSASASSSATGTPPAPTMTSSSATTTVSVVPDDEATEKTDVACTSLQATTSNSGSQLSNGSHDVVSDSCSTGLPKPQQSSSSASHQGTSRSTGAVSKSTLSTLSDPFEPESVRRQALLKNGGGSRNGFTGDSKVLAEANRTRPAAHAGMGLNVVQSVEGSAVGQCQHTETKMMVLNGAGLPPGMVLGPPHLHCNGGPPPGNGVRPMKNMFSGAGEMLQMPCGPAPMPPPMHLHPGQQSYAYYQMPGPWAPRARNGVLPLPQPGGFLVSGPPGMGMSMGSLPPMSVPMPASIPSLPPGMATPGHFQVPMPNGLNPHHLRESVYLSRYGGRSSGAPPLDTRIVTSAAMQGMAVPPQEAMLQEDKKQQQGGDGGSPGRADAAPFTTSAPTESEISASVPKDSCGSSSSDSGNGGGSFSRFHFGNGGAASSPADQVLEPESSSLDSSPQKAKLHAVPTTTSTSEPSVPEISRTRRCVDEHAAGAPAGEYSLFAAAPGKGFGFF